MTYPEMKDYFLILQDKFGSPYHTDDEIALLLNRAQLDYVVSFLPIDDTLNVELNAATSMRIKPLLFYGEDNMTVDGAILKSDIDTSLGYPVIRLLGMAVNEKPATHVRLNNWYTFIQNAFKTPTAEYPIVREGPSGWLLRPIDVTATVQFFGIRHPRTLLADGSISCELPDFTHNDIVARALDFAGVGSRDQMLSELKKMNNV